MWTQERIKRFWEACGFKQANKSYHYEQGQRVADWLYPDNTSHRALPSITDLNALFKYAVPKYIEIDASGNTPNCISNAYRRLFERWLKELIWMNWEDPALALAGAIEKAIIGE